MGQKIPPGALYGLRILELADRMGHYCGKLLADLGADVIVVEPPGGAAARRVGPFLRDEPHPERSLYFLNFNTGKRSVLLDLTQAKDRDAFRELVRHAEAVVESFPPGYLDCLGLGYEALSQINPGLVMTSISGFGQTGPYASYKAPDIVAFAMGGVMFFNGDPSLPPLVGPWEQGYHMAGVHAAYATLLALYNRLSTGRGQHIDISIQEVLLSKPHPQVIARYDLFAEIQMRSGSQTTGGVPAAIYPCKDGYVSFAIFSKEHWHNFREWIGNPPELMDPVWDEQTFRYANADVVDLFVLSFTRERTVAEIVAEGQARHIATAPLNSPVDYIKSPQVQARGFLVEAEHPEMGRYRCPGAPYQLSGTPWRLGRPAPRLGEHSAEVLAQAPEGAKAARAAWEGVARWAGRWDQPLFHGVRIVDFTHRIAGPFGTRLLADHGAQVIKVDSAKVTERSILGYQLDRNKLSISVDLTTEQGRQLITRLIKISDVVIENFSLRVMKRWHLTHEELRALKPDLIMLSMQGLGQTGPHREYVTWGPNLLPLTGMTYLWAHPDVPPSSGRLMNAPLWAYPDFAAPVHGAVALVAALLHRARTGEGQYIDLAQAEATAALMGPAYLDYLVNGRPPKPQGNGNPEAAPHGCYRCKGWERWCVIAVESDEEWRHLRQALGEPPWARDPKFDSVAGRLQHRQELDRHLEEWTSQYTPHQVMRLLQKAGVAAGAVQNAEDLYFDYHLRERGFLAEVEHAEVGKRLEPGPPIRMSHTPAQILRGAPRLGQDNRYVFGELLGLSTQEMAALAESGVLV